MIEFPPAQFPSHAPSPGRFTLMNSAPMSEGDFTPTRLCMSRAEPSILIPARRFVLDTSSSLARCYHPILIGRPDCHRTYLIPSAAVPNAVGTPTTNPIGQTHLESSCSEIVKSWPDRFRRSIRISISSVFHHIAGLNTFFANSTRAPRCGELTTCDTHRLPARPRSM